MSISTSMLKREVVVGLKKLRAFWDGYFDGGLAYLAVQPTTGNYALTGAVLSGGQGLVHSVWRWLREDIQDGGHRLTAGVHRLHKPGGAESALSLLDSIVS